MTSEQDNLVLRLLQEIRTNQTETNAQLATLTTRVEKQTVEIINVRGSLRKVEEGMEAIAGVLSRELDLLK